MAWVEKGKLEIKCPKCKHTNVITIPALPVTNKEQKAKT
jgi:phage FluMu protein Com